MAAYPHVRRVRHFPARHALRTLDPHRQHAVPVDREWTLLSLRQRKAPRHLELLRIDLDELVIHIRTGDMLHLKATPKRTNGTPVTDVALTWSYTYAPDESIVPNGFPGGGGIVQFGRFVANYPGRYTLLAQYGSASARTTIQVAPRDVRRRITVMGRGNINETHTSDLWPGTGKDGRDYALVGTCRGNGYAMFFDITDPTNIVKTDSVQVNARTINDVTVSLDGRYGVLSRGRIET